MASRLRLDGYFFKPQSAQKQAGIIEFTRRIASIICDETAICSDVTIQSIQGKKDIYLANGYLFTLDEPLNAEQTSYLSHKASRGIAWFEKFSIFKAIILSLILLSLIVGLRLALTAMTPLTVSIFPHEWERQIGSNTYAALEKTILSDTDLSADRLERLRSKAHHMASENGFEEPDIFFHKSEFLGANALAFAGGPIVVTDELVKLLETDDLILGVIAHEFAHIRQRHSLHQIIEVIGVAVLASVLLGADDTLIEEASLIGINVWANKNSRRFEQEADRMGVDYLENANLEASSMRSAIRKLTEHLCELDAAQSLEECLSNTQAGWLSSHPPGAKRIEYLEPVQ